jgi:hypothetical protein
MLKRRKNTKIFYPIIGSLVLLFSSVCYADDIYTQYQQVEVPSALSTIANVMVGVAFIISVFKLAQIGFKFMTSVSGRTTQEAKASLLPWIIGVGICALYFVLGDTIIKTLTSGVDSNIFG